MREELSRLCLGASASFSGYESVWQQSVNVLLEVQLEYFKRRGQAVIFEGLKMTAC